MADVNSSFSAQSRFKNETKSQIALGLSTRTELRTATKARNKPTKSCVDPPYSPFSRCVFLCLVFCGYVQTRVEGEWGGMTKLFMGLFRAFVAVLSSFLRLCFRPLYWRRRKILRSCNDASRGRPPLSREYGRHV